MTCPTCSREVEPDDFKCVCGARLRPEKCLTSGDIGSLGRGNSPSILLEPKGVFLRPKAPMELEIDPDQLHWLPRK